MDYGSLYLCLLPIGQTTLGIFPFLNSNTNYLLFWWPVSVYNQFLYFSRLSIQRTLGRLLDHSSSFCPDWSPQFQSGCALTNVSPLVLNVRNAIIYIKYYMSFSAILFSVFFSVTTLSAYQWIFGRILRSLPKSFTLGEASIVTQGLVLMLVNVLMLLIDYSHHIPETDMQKMSAVIQVLNYFKILCCEYIYNI